MSINYAPKPGRPRQPYCPDCRKKGKYVLKEKAQGYCKACQRIRVRRAYIGGRRANDPNYVHPEERQNTLVADLKGHIERVGKENVSLEFIRNMYHENALPCPDDDELTREYLTPDEPIGPDLADMTEEDFREMAEKFRRSQLTAYDPED